MFRLFAGPICEGWGCTPLVVLVLAPFAAAFAAIVGVYIFLIGAYREKYYSPQRKKRYLIGIYLFTAFLLSLGGYWYWYEATHH
jgi:hypothetical protein